jgi:hypothetical protein
MKLLKAIKNKIKEHERRNINADIERTYGVTIHNGAMWIMCGSRAVEKIDCNDNVYSVIHKIENMKYANKQFEECFEECTCIIEP